MTAYEGGVGVRKREMSVSWGEGLSLHNAPAVCSPFESLRTNGQPSWVEVDAVVSAGLEIPRLRFRMTVGWGRGCYCTRAGYPFPLREPQDERTAQLGRGGRVDGVGRTDSLVESRRTRWVSAGFEIPQLRSEWQVGRWRNSLGSGPFVLREIEGGTGGGRGAVGARGCEIPAWRGNDEVGVEMTVGWED